MLPSKTARGTLSSTTTCWTAALCSSSHATLSRKRTRWSGKTTRGIGREAPPQWRNLPEVGQASTTTSRGGTKHIISHDVASACGTQDSSAFISGKAPAMQLKQFLGAQRQRGGKGVPRSNKLGRQRSSTGYPGPLLSSHRGGGRRGRRPSSWRASSSRAVSMQCVSRAVAELS